MIIYKVTNKINNKVYIGQTIKTLQDRKYVHIRESNNGNGFYFHRALKKYGPENFDWKIICECNNIKSLNKQEEYYIAKYNSMEEGYNSTSGGLNYIRSKETKNKMSIAQSGKNNPMYGKKHSEEAKKRMSISSSDKKQSEETKNKMSITKSGKNNPMYGKKHSEETKQKMSIARKKYLANKKDIK